MNANSDHPTPSLSRPVPVPMAAPVRPTACYMCGEPLDHLSYSVWVLCSAACARERLGGDE